MTDAQKQMDSTAFATDLKQFAKEFETAIEILEERYFNLDTCHAMEMRARIREMRELLNTWRSEVDNGPTQYQVFTILNSVAMHLLPGNDDAAGEICVAMTFYLALNRMRQLTGSTWLACTLYDMEHELLNSVKEIHPLTTPSR